MPSQLSVKDSSVSWTPTDDGLVVVLDTRTSRYLSLNTSGSLLWTKLAGGATLDDLVSSLTETFGLDRRTAGVDVNVFLQSLREQDLLAE